MRASPVVKNLEYRATPSIQHYLILEQDRVAATPWSRSGADWLGTLVTGDGSRHFPALDVAIALNDLYEGVSLPER